MRAQYTGLGYRYYRCRAAGTDDTVYEHQLVALLDHDPGEVFDPDRDVHHDVPVPWLNYPGNLDVEEAREHRVSHLEGREVSA